MMPRRDSSVLCVLSRFVGALILFLVVGQLLYDWYAGYYDPVAYGLGGDSALGSVVLPSRERERPWFSPWNTVKPMGALVALALTMPLRRWPRWVAVTIALVGAHLFACLRLGLLMIYGSNYTQAGPATGPLRELVGAASEFLWFSNIGKYSATIALLAVVAGREMLSARSDSR